MNQYNDCGSCDDEQIDRQRCSIELFVPWAYGPVHDRPPITPTHDTVGPWLKSGRWAPVSGLEQTSFERRLSATPKRREAARGIDRRGAGERKKPRNVEALDPSGSRQWFRWA